MYRALALTVAASCSHHPGTAPDAAAPPDRLAHGDARVDAGGDGAPVATGVHYVTLAMPTTVACDDPTEPGQPSFAGCTRDYFVYVPTTYTAASAASFPVVIALHGNGQDAAHMMGGSAYDAQLNAHGQPDTDDHSGLEGRLDELAETNGFIAIYPDGSPRGSDGSDGNKWSDCRAAITATTTASGADDVAFIQRAVGDVAARYPKVDLDHVFALGYSNGGEMVERLYYNDADASSALPIRGFALIEADFAANPKPDCVTAPATPRAVLLVQGDADHFMPYADSVATSPTSGSGSGADDGLLCAAPGLTREATCSRGLVWDAAQSVVRWQALTGSTTQTSAVPLGNDPDVADHVTLTETRYQSPGAAPLWVDHQVGGGHTVPGAYALPALYTAVLGPKDLDFGFIDTGTTNASATAPRHPDGAADKIWAFFASL